MGRGLTQPLTRGKMRYAILSRLAEIKPRILKEEVSTRLTLTIMRQNTDVPCIDFLKRVLTDRE